ncbi:class I SAM-dependent methyltransferase [bacterium]|nr:class I SAM-dependent methyltransferase [bacterium]
MSNNGKCPILRKLRNDRWPRNRHEALVYFTNKGGRRILDIGCGNGLVLYNIAKKFECLTGIEMSENLCKKARNNLAEFGDSVEIINDRIENGLDKPDGWFDTIIWSDVIEHVVDIFQAMNEISRLLMPGGILITTTPNVAYLKRRIRLLFGTFPSTNSSETDIPGLLNKGGHVHYFTVNTLKTLYKHVNINPIRTVGYGRLGWLQKIRPSLLSGAAMVIGRRE